ncbi:alcohol dehydrogenase catalytic domain-containing protein [Streptomyces sp. ODS28]|uniref:zinc-dependent alcohol dehydrogenase n=1 Tax=Streptomyces sp. ODS28 TaxID=3136688 RepID=UPI0031E6EB60
MHTTSSPRAPGRPGPLRARAVVVDAPGSYRLISGPRANPGPGEVRIAVSAAGISEGDRAVYEGALPPDRVRYPVLPGREWAGVIDAVGEGGDPGLVGRRAVAESPAACLHCERCGEGLPALCENAGAGGTGPGATSAYGARAGGFADAVVVPERLLHLLPDDADLRAAALLEPAAVAAAAVLAAGPVPGARTAVVGADTTGLLAVQLLAAYSPGELLVTDPRVRRAEPALDLGASAVRAPGEARGAEYDVVVEAAGAPTSAAEACALVRGGGRLVLAGRPGPGARGLDPASLVERQLTVSAVAGASPASWGYAVRAFTGGLLTPGALITHELGLEEFGAAMALAASGDQGVGKVLLRP